MDAFNPSKDGTILCKIMHRYPDRDQLYKVFTAAKISSLKEKKIISSLKMLSGLQMNKVTDFKAVQRRPTSLAPVQRTGTR
jgi:hypothetical protein